MVIEGFREELTTYKEKLAETDEWGRYHSTPLRFTPKELTAFSAERALIRIGKKNRMAFLFGIKSELRQELDRRLETINATDAYQSFLKKFFLRARAGI